MQLETQVNIGKIQFSIPNSQSPPQENNYDSRKASLEVGQMSFCVGFIDFADFFVCFDVLDHSIFGPKADHTPSNF